MGRRYVTPATATNDQEPKNSKQVKKIVSEDFFLRLFNNVSSVVQQLATIIMISQRSESDKIKLQIKVTFFVLFCNSVTLVDWVRLWQSLRDRSLFDVEIEEPRASIAYTKKHSEILPHDMFNECTAILDDEEFKDQPSVVEFRRHKLRFTVSQSWHWINETSGGTLVNYETCTQVEISGAVGTCRTVDLVWQGQSFSVEIDINNDTIITIKVFGPSPEWIKKFLKRGHELSIAKQVQENKTSSEMIYTWRDSWHPNPRPTYKTLKNIFLPLELHIKIKKFIDDREMRMQLKRDLGQPCKDGVLMIGLPGSGKTSLSYGIANTLGQPLYVLRLNTYDIGDTLDRQIRGIPPNSCIMLDDMDQLFEKETVSSTDDESIDISTLLNELKIDKPRKSKRASELEEKNPLNEKLGRISRKMAAQDNKSISKRGVQQLLKIFDGYDCINRCTILVTANTDTFPEALIRPGRIDQVIVMNGIDYYQVECILNRFGLTACEIKVPLDTVITTATILSKFQLLIPTGKCTEEMLGVVKTALDHFEIETVELCCLCWLSKPLEVV